MELENRETLKLQLVKVNSARYDMECVLHAIESIASQMTEADSQAVQRVREDLSSAVVLVLKLVANEVAGLERDDRRRRTLKLVKSA